MALMTLWTANRWPCFSVRKMKKAMGEYLQAAMTQVLIDINANGTMDEDASKAQKALMTPTDMAALLGAATKGTEDIKGTREQIEQSYSNSDEDLKAAIDQAKKDIHEQALNRTELAQKAFDKALAGT